MKISLKFAQKFIFIKYMPNAMSMLAFWGRITLEKNDIARNIFKWIINNFFSESGIPDPGFSGATLREFQIFGYYLRYILRTDGIQIWVQILGGSRHCSVQYFKKCQFLNQNLPENHASILFCHFGIHSNT